MSLFDLKVINSVLGELEEDRGIPREKVISAIEMALAAAYKKEYGKRGQIIRAAFNTEMGDVEFKQIKIVVDETLVRPEEENPAAGGEEPAEIATDDERTRFNPEHHIMIEDARLIKKGVELDDEVDFPLEAQEDFGRIAAQTAKQVIMQKIREAEKVSIIEEFGEHEGQVVSGHVQRFERGNLYVDLGRATGILPYEEQIPGERYRQGERIRALLYKVDESPRGTFLKLSRSHPQFLLRLFELESPELANGTIEIKEVAREAGSRSKLAVVTHDDHIDPVGSLVGQRGVRVSTVTSELGGEKIDIIEWSEDTREFIERALSPAETLSVEISEDEKRAAVEVTEDQQSLAIGRGGQNVRLAAKLTGWGIDIKSAHGEALAETDGEGEVEIPAPTETKEAVEETEDHKEEIVTEQEEKKETDTDTEDLPAMSAHAKQSEGAEKE
ncbi:MAG: transcription termination/antitermination protein NusA [Parcubacteria group bacterium]|nr:transcription termination/antitermination protein NusA [Parcubacteria group bacterium]|tara:strand:- start:4597 stop:5925 length:1329 start_codon:yes stop_codon:yes gene_type:complete